MKRLMKIYGLVLLSAIVLSCTHSELQQEEHYGYLTVGLTDDEDIVQVKSDAGEEEKVYRLEVYDADGNMDFSTDDHRLVSDANPIRLLMGKYDVKAIYGEPGTAFNLPCYSGSNSVRVMAEKPAEVDILCKMGKVKFSVHFPEDDDFAAKFSLYELSVKADDKVLTFSSSVSATGFIGKDALVGSFRDTAYFEVPESKTLTYTLRMVNADNVQYTVTKEIANVEAAEHYHFDFKLGEPEDIDGALVLEIALNGDYSNVESHNIILNFDKTYMPSYKTNSEFTPVPADGSIPSWPLGNETTKKFIFDAPRGIRNLVITHLDAELLEEGLPQVIDFMDMDASQSQVMDDIGIAYTVTKTSENMPVQAEIDITEFMKNIHITPEGETYMMSLTVIDEYDRYARCDFEFTVVSDIQAETASYFRWSSWAILKGRYFAKTPPSGMTFLYRKASDTDWIEIDEELITVDINTMSFSCRLNHLTPDTEYVFMATSDKDLAEGKEASMMTFKTYGAEGSVYNLNFDHWMKGDGKTYNDTQYDSDAWYPTNDLSRIAWDTANGGTASLGCFPTGPEESVLAVPGTGKKAAKMVSQMTTGLIKKFAAGNIYTGKFLKVSISPAGAQLDWGIPFTSRPLALRGWYRYEPKEVTQRGTGYENYTGMDKCQIQIFLTDWTSMFRINAYTDASQSTFVKFTEDYILAHGELITDNDTTDDPNNTNGYVQFTIPLEYRSLKNPSYIVISGAASRYGDYFTGGEGSTLYLDELELIYDPDLLTDEQFNSAMGGILQ